MDVERVAALRDALAHTAWWGQAREIGRAVRRTPGPGHLLLVGTPRVEPWHLAAHLQEESEATGAPQLAPALVRWNPPAAGPAHLSIGLSRLELVARGETVLVVAPEQASDALLERVDDARRIGATVLSLDAGDSRLGSLAHERMTVSSTGLALPEGLSPDTARSTLDVPPDVLAGLALPASFEVAQHFVSVAAGGTDDRADGGWRARLGRLIDAVSGPAPRARPGA
jgi:hypothetical protein